MTAYFNNRYVPVRFIDIASRIRERVLTYAVTKGVTLES